MEASVDRRLTTTCGVGRLSSVTALVAIGILLLSHCGCSRLVVKKVSLQSRNTDCDYETKGFRYYLARPYVIVKEPIVVAVNRQVQPVERSRLSDLVETPPEMKQANECKEPALTCNELNQIRQLLKKAETAEKKSDSATQQSHPEEPPTGGRDTGRTKENKDSTGQQGSQDGGASSVDFYSIDAKEITQASNLKGKIEIQFLPDLDEQYAVHHRNIAAIGSHKLVFKDGWQLVSVDGSFDSTTVAEELIKTLDSAIKAASSATNKSSKALQAASTSPTGSGGNDQAAPGKMNAGQEEIILLTVTRTRMIMPGVYRINKPWEMNDQSAMIGAGFLSHLGLEICETVEYGLAELPK